MIMKSLVRVALCSFAGCNFCGAVDEPVDLAVVVNKGISLDALSASDVRLMILGEKAKWPNGTAIVAVQTAPDSPGRALQLKTVDRMTDAVLKRYYMQALFIGKEIAQPKEFASAAALKQFVAHSPGAIGCILASEVDDSVKVLKVDGASPGDPGYKLR
jgi:hypothetical protein